MELSRAPECRVTGPGFALRCCPSQRPKESRAWRTAMDDRANASGHLMLITPERVFYAVVLGRPRERCPGAFYVCVALRGGLWLTTADGREAYGELVATAPNLRPT